MTESYAKLSFDGLIDIQNKRYFSSNCFNGLIEVDNQTNTTRIVKRFPQENIFMYLMHHKIVRSGNELIFTPDLARTIHVMNLSSMEINCINFAKNFNYESRCIDSYIWDGKLWLFFSNRKTPITSMDLSTYRIEHYPQLTKPLEEITKDEYDAVFWSPLYKEQGQIYGVLYSSQYIIHIDLVHMNTEYFLVTPTENKLADIAVNGNTAYLTAFNSREVILYSLTDGSIEKCMPVFPPDPTEGAGYLYSNIILEQGNLLLIPNYGNRILYIQNNQIMPFCSMPEGHQDVTGDGRITWRRFYSSESVDGLIRLFPARSNMLVEIDVKERKATGKSYRMPSEWIHTGYYTDYVSTYVKEAARDGTCMPENDVVNLKDYIQVLKSLEL